ncbi:MAG: M1 family metallopeptidase, partial [bacterium]|nr:M1 family metallopeptidase [bacterium]
MDRHTHLKKTALFILFACAIMAVFASKTPVYGKNEKPGLTIPLYRQLNECKFSMEKIPVPTGGLKFNRDNASWSLESGHIQLMEPTPDGRITGLIFEGQGRFRMTIPNWVEREQFKRYTAKKDCKEVDDFFDKLIIRTPGAVLEQLPQLRQDLKYEKNKFAEHRHKHWIKSVGVDINARVTAGLLNPGDEFLWVEMDTRKFNKLTYVFDKYRREEIKLLKFKHRLNFKEIWLSLDRDSDRDKSGFPGINRRSRFDMIALDIEADLTDAKSNLYFTEIKAAGFKTKLTVTPKEKGLRMMELSLPKARINKVLNSEGKELPFIRKQAHKDILNKERDRFTESFWVLLDKTYKKDEAFEIVVDYKLDLENYTEGDSWYPTTPDNPYKKYMIRFTAKHPAKLDIIAVGERLEETKTGKIKISTWNSRTPLEMYG